MTDQVQKAKEKKPKKKRVVLRILLIFLIFISTLFATLTVHWLIDRSPLSNYVPFDARALVRIQSVSNLALKALDNKSIGSLLANLGVEGLSDKLFELKKQISRSKDLISTLLDLPSYLVVDKKNQFLILIDSGWRGIGLQLAPIVGSMFSIDGLELSKTQKNNRTVFGIKLSPSETWYFCYDHGQILASNSIDAIADAFKVSSDLSLQINIEEIKNLDKLSENDLAVRADFKDAIGKKGDDLTGKLLMTLPELDKGSMGLGFQNNGLDLVARVNYANKEADLTRIFERSGVPKAIANLPKSVNLFSMLRISSLSDLYTTSKKIDPASVPDQKTLDDLLKTAFGMNLQETLFDWAGSELITASLEGFSSPVFAISVDNKDKLNNTLKKISDSLLVDLESNYTIDEVKLTRIAIPDLWKMIAKWFNVELTLPWIRVEGDLLLVSEDPSAIAKWSNDLKNKELLRTDRQFIESQKSSSDLDSDLLVFFKSSKHPPALIRSLPFAGQAIDSFKSGLIALEIGREETRLNIRLRGSRANAIDLLSGYPKSFELALRHDSIVNPEALIVKNLLEGANPEVLYFDDNNQVVTASISGKKLATLSLEGAARLKDTGVGIIAFDAKGHASWLNKTLDGVLKTFDTKIFAAYPIVSSRNGITGYVDETNSLDYFGVQDEHEVLFKDLVAPLTFPTIIRDSRYIVTPHSLLGEVFVYDLDKEGLKPQVLEAGSILAAAPIVLSNGHLGLVTESGQVHFKDLDNPSEVKAPIETKKVIKTPALVWNDAIVVIATDGTLMSVSERTGLTNSRQFNDLSGEISGFALDPKSKYLLVSQGNEIYAFNSDFSLVQGFPVEGTRPYFYDLDGDDKNELVTVNSKGMLYVYEMP